MSIEAMLQSAAFMEKRKARDQYLRGYWQALFDYGIWKDGVQSIGCLETPIKECMLRKARQFQLSEEGLHKVLTSDGEAME